MEASEAPNDATPPLISGEIASNLGDCNLDDSYENESIDPEEHNDVPATGEDTEAARDVVEAVIGHAGAVDEAAIEDAGTEPTDDAAMDEESTCDTVPMLEEESAAVDELPVETTDFASDAADAEMKDESQPPESIENSATETTTPAAPDESQPTEGESSQPPPESIENSATETTTPAAQDESQSSGGESSQLPAESIDGSFTEKTEPPAPDESQPTGGDSSQPPPESIEGTEEVSEESTLPPLPPTFPHCYICGFDRETAFVREKKATTGQHKNKNIYRNRCVRKACVRYFGPSYIWDVKAGQYVKVADETGAGSRPFASEPREEKFPDVDYQKASQSGVFEPLEKQYGAASRGQKGGKATADTASTSTSNSPQIPSTSSATPPAQKTSKTAAAAKSSAASKRLRKGYQWVADEEDPLPPPVLDHVMDYVRAQQLAQEAALARQETKERGREVGRKEEVRRECGTQTGDDEHALETIVDDLRSKMTFQDLKPTEEAPLTRSVMLSLTNRLFLAQKTIRMQTTELISLRKERDFVGKNTKKIMKLVKAYRETLLTDILRLKEDVVVANRELRNFTLEMQAEGNKDIKDIAKIKNDVAKRLDDSERYKRKVEAEVKYHQALKEEADLIADNYHRMTVELEKKVNDSKIEEEDARNKLNDKIYLTNNAKCAHCQVNERIKGMLTEQIADKTLCASNLSKERADLARKLENSERIVSIISKENKQLKFEMRAWEANSHKLKIELTQLRGNAAGLVLPASTPSSSSAPGEAAFTPQSVTTAKDSEEVSPDRNGDDAIEIDRPPPSSSAVSSEEGEYKSPGASPNTLARLPPPPLPPSLPQLKEKEKEPAIADPFANWIPKERKAQEMPPEMAEAMRKVAESLERGPKKEEKGGGGPPQNKKEKRDEKGAGAKAAKRSGPPPHPPNTNNKNGEKKPKLDGGVRKEEKRAPPPPPAHPRTIPTKAADPTEKGRDPRAKEPSPTPTAVPFSSAHEPAYPAVVVAKKSLKVPYNGPATITLGSSSSSSATSSPRPPKKTAVTPEKKPMSFLPVAGSLALPPLKRDPPPPSRPGDLSAILREAERLRKIERDREMRDRAAREREFAAAAADRRASIQPLMREGPPPARFADFDEGLPWNAGRQPAAAPPSYQSGRPRTPVQDWYMNEPAALAPPPRPRPPSPRRYYDDVYDPRAPRDQFGRLEPDFGAARQPPQYADGRPPAPHPLLPPHAVHRGGPPPPLLQAPPPHDQWRREWHGGEAPPPNWNNEPPRRGYWD